MLSTPMNCVHHMRTPFPWARETVGVHRQRCYFQNARLWRCFHWGALRAPLGIHGFRIPVNPPAKRQSPWTWQIAPSHSKLFQGGISWGERAVLCFLRAIFIRREYTPSHVLREGGGVGNMSLNVAESLRLGCTLDAPPFPRCPRDARRTAAPPHWRHSALPAQRCSPQGGGMRAAAP